MCPVMWVEDACAFQRNFGDFLITFSLLESGLIAVHDTILDIECSHLSRSD